MLRGSGSTTGEKKEGKGEYLKGLRKEKENIRGGTRVG
jgi:hypothetical protein